MIGGGLMSAGGNEYGSIVSGVSEAAVANSSESDVRAIGGLMKATSSGTLSGISGVQKSEARGRKPNLLTSDLRKMKDTHQQYSSLVQGADVYYQSYRQSGDDKVYQQHKNTVDRLKRWKELDAKDKGRKGFSF